MLKFILPTLLSFTPLFAEQATQSELNSIYTEAILFVAVFGIMGIISYIYSSRHAKSYVAPVVKVKKKTIQELKDERIAELLHLFKKEVLTQEEYDVLKEQVQNSTQFEDSQKD